MQDSTARMVGTVGIWAAVAVTLTFGVFKMNWNDAISTGVMFLIVAVICYAAAASTAAIWGRKIGGIPMPNTEDKAPPSA